MRDALSEIVSAVTVVTVADGRDDIGVTVSAFCPVSAEPPLVGICLIGDSYPAELLGRTGGPAGERRFAVTVLAAGQRAIAGRFAVSGRPSARHLLDGIPHHRGEHSGALIPDHGLVAFECEVDQRVPAGDHLLVIGRVLAVQAGDGTAGPLVRFRSHYPVLTS